MIRLLSIVSSTAAEIGQQGEPRPAALLRVELDRDKIFFRDGGAEADSVLRPPRSRALVGRRRVIGMDEIELRTFRNIGKNGMTLPESHTVPSHVGNLQPLPPCFKARRETPDRSGDDAEAGGIALLAPLENHLGAEANSENGFALPHPFLQLPIQTPFTKIGHRRPGRTDAGEDDVARRIQFFRIIGNDPFFVLCKCDLQRDMQR